MVRLSMMIFRTQEESTGRISSLNAERDDLKALLLATLQACPLGPCAL